MSTLVLVRHGQARAFDADSDRLSERGEEQARVLGRTWAAAAVAVDEVFTGSLVRQRRTAELVGEAFRAEGRPWPEPTVDPRWNEYDSGGVLGTLMPALARRDAAFASLVATFQDAAARPDRNRHFQRMFEVLMDAWEQGAIGDDGVEPFAGFHGRVSAAFGDLTAKAGSGRVVVFTSGGPIGVCTQVSLDAPRRSALRLNWRVKNASITELLFSEGRISLDSFNVVEHLPPPLRTFR